MSVLGFRKVTPFVNSIARMMAREVLGFFSDPP